MWAGAPLPDAPLPSSWDILATARKTPRDCDPAVSRAQRLNGKVYGRRGASTIAFGSAARAPRRSRGTGWAGPRPGRGRRNGSRPITDPRRPRWRAGTGSVERKRERQCKGAIRGRTNVSVNARVDARVMARALAPAWEAAGRTDSFSRLEPHSGCAVLARPMRSRIPGRRSAKRDSSPLARTRSASSPFFSHDPPPARPWSRGNSLHPAFSNARRMRRHEKSGCGAAVQATKGCGRCEAGTRRSGRGKRAAGEVRDGLVHRSNGAAKGEWWSGERCTRVEKERSRQRDGRWE